MQPTHKSINYTLSHNLCTGCGVCEGACPSKAITTIVKEGRFLPKIDDALCRNKKGCHRCMDACPGVGVNLKQIAQEQLQEEKTVVHPLLGNYISCVTGHSTEHDIRYHAASGGMLSQVLIFLLEKGYIDGAVVTKFDSTNKLLVHSFIATTREEILAAKSSKYSPVTLNKAIQEIKAKEGRFIIVGVPCHIQGFRKYEQLDKKFKEKIVGYFGIYCSSGRSFYLTEHVFKERNIKKEGLTYLAYRDEGCLGSMVVRGNNDSKPFEYKERYQSYFHPLRSFFIPRRCLLCIDHFAELTDVSFGDIHVAPYLADKIGVNSVIIRNSKFLTWLEEAKEAGVMQVEPLEPELLVKSQIVAQKKKTKVGTFMQIDRWLGRKVPQYDINLKPYFNWKYVVIYIHTMAQIFIGRNKSLWFLIDKLKSTPPKE